MPCENWDSEGKGLTGINPRQQSNSKLRDTPKAHSTPLLCRLICAAPQKPFAGKESNDSPVSRGSPVRGSLGPRTPCPDSLGLPGPRAQGSACPWAPVSQQAPHPVSKVSSCPWAPVSEDSLASRWQTQQETLSPSSCHLARESSWVVPVIPLSGQLDFAVQLERW